MTDQPVLDVPQEWEIRDELQRLVLADLHGPLGGDDEEFSGENLIDRYPLDMKRLTELAETLTPRPARLTGSGAVRSPFRPTR